MRPNNSVRDSVLKVIADQLDRGIHEIKDESAFEVLGADSLDQIEIVIALEEEFEIEISDADADQADTVGKLIALVERMVGK